MLDGFFFFLSLRDPWTASTIRSLVFFLFFPLDFGYDCIPCRRFLPDVRILVLSTEQILWLGIWIGNLCVFSLHWNHIYGVSASLKYLTEEQPSRDSHGFFFPATGFRSVYFHFIYTAQVIPVELGGFIFGLFYSLFSGLAIGILQVILGSFFFCLRLYGYILLPDVIKFDSISMIR